MIPSSGSASLLYAQRRASLAGGREGRERGDGREGKERGREGGGREGMREEGERGRGEDGREREGGERMGGSEGGGRRRREKGIRRGRERRETHYLPYKHSFHKPFVEEEFSKFVFAPITEGAVHHSK